MKKPDPDVAERSPQRSAVPTHRGARRWAAATLVLSASLLAGLLRAPAASACGATPSRAFAHSPAEGATGVPLNAVLIASSSYRVVRFTLREADSGRALPLSISCETQAGPQLCLARPGLLAANTRYLWTAEPEPHEGQVTKPGATEPELPTMTFTTGAGTDQAPPFSGLTPQLGPLFVVELLEHQRPEPNNCGITDVVRLRISLPSLDEPVVLAASGMGGLPEPWGQKGAPVVTPQAPSVESAFWAAPACIGLRLYDVAGNVRHLPPWCPPGQTSPPAGARTSAPGDDPAAPTPELTTGCTSSPGRPPTALAGLAVLVALWAAATRRRRR